MNRDDAPELNDEFFSRATEYNKGVKNMTRDDIIRMAREADCLDEQHYGSVWANKLELFAQRVAAAAKAEEREVCMSACQQIANAYIDSTDALSVGIKHGAISCAIAIELRGETNEKA